MKRGFSRITMRSKFDSVKPPKEAAVRRQEASRRRKKEEALLQATGSGLASGHATGAAVKPYERLIKTAWWRSRRSAYPRRSIARRFFILDEAAG